MSHCTQAFEEFEVKLKQYQEKKLSMAKAIQRGARQTSIFAIAKQLGGSEDEGDNQSTTSSQVIQAAQAAQEELMTLIADSKEQSNGLDQQEEEESGSPKSKKKVLGTLVQNEHTIIYYR